MKDSDQEDIEKSKIEKSMKYVSLYALMFVTIALVLSADKLQTSFEGITLLVIMLILILMMIYSVIDGL